jgi:type II secretory pathway pseudopilin PulG
MVDMRRIKTFTLVELIMSIIIVALAAIPISIMYQRSMQGSVANRMLTVASSLAEQKMEETLNLGFSAATSQGPNAFSAPFNEYSYQVIVHYVQAADLNTSVDPTVTDYKNIEVRVTNNFSAPVSLTALLTNN